FPALRGVSAVPGDFSAARGTVSARVSLDMPLINDVRKKDVSYVVEGEIANFAADKAIGGHKAEAGSLRVYATPASVQFKGDIRIAGAPAHLDYRFATGGAEAEVRLSATFDEASRKRLNLDFGGALAGNVSVKLAGRKRLQGPA